jgi:signal transduction histidine kinase
MMLPSFSLDRHAAQQRERFDALRRKAFEEIGQAGAKWRLAWVLPFNVAVVTLLAVRGEPLPRIGLQVAATVACAVMFLLQVFRPALVLKVPTLFVGAACILTSIGATGGLGSPLLITTVLLIQGAAIQLHEPRWMRPVFFWSMLAGFVVMALLSRTAVGEMPMPLSAAAGWSTPEYVVIALMSTAFVSVGLYRSGCLISRAYERVALELAERREELCSETEDRTRALEGIAARLAHEVKNPLAAIKGLSTHVARSAADPKVAERLSIVAAEADRLQSIVDGFLSFSRGFDDLKLGPTKPYELARELALLLETRAADVGIRLEVTGDEAIKVNADGRKIRQAMLNLVLNAMQAAPKDSVVTMDVGRALAGSVRIKVIDRGPGMTADVLERIRKPYFTTKEGGTGLGVALARGLIEQHGGHLSYESAPGRGTTAMMELPACALKHCLKALPNPLRKAESPEALPSDSPPVGAPARG